MSVTNLTIAANGAITVTGRGYTSSQGPGKPLCGGTGGSYGGEAGTDIYTGCQGPTYGSYSAPVNLGSGSNTDIGGGATFYSTLVEVRRVSE